MPLLLNFAAYLISADRWDEARATAREALGLAGDTHRLVWRAWALQHLAAVTILSADAAAPNPANVRGAVLILGYVDGRVAAYGSPREYTEAQEYERVRTALRTLLGPEETSRLLADGAAIGEDRAVSAALAL